MNAAARVISQNNVFQGSLYEMHFSKELLLLLILLSSMLFSALGVIFITNSYRLSLTNYESLLQRQDQLKIENSKLLLEQASWAAPNRVEGFAKTKLGMYVPSEEKNYYYYIRIK
jgi:cell division protein FtsL